MYQFLVNVLLRSYFQPCLLYITDDIVDRTRDNQYNVINSMKSYPMYLISQKDKINLKVLHCQDFIIHTNNSTQTINYLEEYLRERTFGDYNNRKYLILLDENESMPQSWSILNNLYNIIFVKSTNQAFELYMHNYKKTRGNNTISMVNIWYNTNNTFKSTKTCFSTGLSKQLGRELVIGVVDNVPYVNTGNICR